MTAYSFHSSRLACRSGGAASPVGAGRLLVAGLALSIATLSSGCETTKDPRDMTEAEKAKAISTRRKQADHEFETFRASDGDIEALKRYAQLHVETTKISPGACELCFFYAGLALAQVGTYYRSEVLLLDQRLQNATPVDAPRLEAEIEKTIAVMRRYFLESNQHFEAYFRQVGPLVDSRAYWRIADNYAGLEDWRRALRYLDLFEQVQPLAEGNDLEAIRKNFQMKLRLEEERQLDEELERNGENRSAQRPQLSN